MDIDSCALVTHCGIASSSEGLLIFETR